MSSKKWTYGAMNVWRDGDIEYVGHERIDRTTGKIGALLTIQKRNERGWQTLATLPCLFDDFSRICSALQDIVNLHATERTTA